MVLNNNIRSTYSQFASFDRILDRSFLGYEDIAGTNKLALTTSGEIAFLDTDGDNKLSRTEMVSLQNTINVIKSLLFQARRETISLADLNTRIHDRLEELSEAGKNVRVLSAENIGKLLESGLSAIQTQVSAAKTSPSSNARAINIAGVGIKSQADLQARIDAFLNHISEVNTTTGIREPKSDVSIPALGVLNHYNTNGSYASAEDWKTYSPQLSGTELNDLMTLVLRLKANASASNSDFQFDAKYIQSNDFFSQNLSSYVPDVDTQVQASSRELELLQIILKGPADLNKLAINNNKQKQNILRNIMTSKTGLIPYTNEAYSPEKVQELFEVIDRGDKTQLDLWALSKLDEKFTAVLENYGTQYKTRVSKANAGPSTTQKTTATNTAKAAKAINNISPLTLANVIYKATRALQAATSSTDAGEISAYNLKIAGAAIIAAAKKEAARLTTSPVPTPRSIIDMAKAVWAASPEGQVSGQTFTATLEALMTPVPTSVEAAYTAVANAVKTKTGLTDSDSKITAAINAIKPIKDQSIVATGSFAFLTPIFDLQNAAKIANTIVATSSATTAVYETNKSIATATAAINAAMGRETTIANVKNAAIKTAKLQGASDAHITAATNALTTSTAAAITAAIAAGASPTAAYAAVLAAQVQQSTGADISAVKNSLTDAFKATAKTEAINFASLAAARASLVTIANTIDTTNTASKAKTLSTSLSAITTNTSTVAEFISGLTEAALAVGGLNRSDLAAAEVALAVRAVTTDIAAAKSAAINTATRLGANQGQIYARVMAETIKEKAAATSPTLSLAEIKEAAVNRAKALIPSLSDTEVNTAISTTHTNATATASFDQIKAAVPLAITDDAIRTVIAMAVLANRATDITKLKTNTEAASKANLNSEALAAANTASKFIKDSLVTPALELAILKTNLLSSINKSDATINTAMLLTANARLTAATATGTDPAKILAIRGNTFFANAIGSSTSNAADYLLEKYSSRDASSVAAWNTFVTDSTNAFTATTLITSDSNPNATKTAITAAASLAQATVNGATESTLRDSIGFDSLDTASKDSIIKAAIDVRTNELASKENNKLTQIFKLLYAERNLENMNPGIGTVPAVNPLSKTYEINSYGNSNTATYQQPGAIDLEMDTRISTADIEALVPIFLELNSGNPELSYLDKTQSAVEFDKDLISELSDYADLLKKGLRKEDLGAAFTFIRDASFESGDSIEDRKALVERFLIEAKTDLGAAIIEYGS